MNTNNLIKYLEGYLNDNDISYDNIKENAKRGQSFTFTIYYCGKPYMIAKFFNFLDIIHDANSVVSEKISECDNLDEFMMILPDIEIFQYDIENILESIYVQTKCYKRYVKVGKNANIKLLPKVLYSVDELKINDSFFGLIIEDYIDGIILEHVDFKKYDVDDIIEFLSQMGVIIKELSDNKIVHRDISPDNIILKDGKYVLLDPGFVKLNDNYYTRSNNYIFGKIYYASPEQELGRAKTCDFTSDLYSVGIIALEMGLRYNPLKKLYELENPQGRPREILYKKFNRNTEDELVKNLGENNKTYQLIDIIKRLIEVNRNQRLNSPDIFINYVNTIC